MSFDHLVRISRKNMRRLIQTVISVLLFSSLSFQTRAANPAPLNLTESEMAELLRKLDPYSPLFEQLDALGVKFTPEDARRINAETHALLNVVRYGYGAAAGVLLGASVVGLALSYSGWPNE